MFSTTLDSIKRNRVEKAREIEYLKESVKENKIDDFTEAGESLFFKESVDDLLEAKEYDKLFSSDDSVTEAEEIDRIMNATHDITFNEMIGIE